MDDTFRTQWTITPHLPDESSALVDETHRRTHLDGDVDCKAFT